MGFTQGVASPCCFFHKNLNIACVVHGDDFTALGTDDALNFYEAELQKHFECKLKGRLGSEDGDMKEMNILNRVVSNLCLDPIFYTRRAVLPALSSPSDFERGSTCLGSGS